jgi:hypothetical protein
MATPDTPSTVGAFWMTTGGVVLGIFVGWFLKALSDYWSANRQFEHRLKLEKEYSIYLTLWDTLFEARRAIGNLIEYPAEFYANLKLAQSAFNEYQSVVRKHEPFISPSIYSLSRETTKLCHSIFTNAGKTTDILRMERKSDARDEVMEKLAADKGRIDEENEKTFEEIEKLFQKISQAISDRVRTP